MGAPVFDVIDVGPDNVDETGFFCLTSRRRADGYKRKRAWLDARFSDGLKICMVKQGARGFIETIPGALPGARFMPSQNHGLHPVMVAVTSTQEGAFLSIEYDEPLRSRDAAHAFADRYVDVLRDMARGA